jgi:hypothetical protein
MLLEQKRTATAALTAGRFDEEALMAERFSVFNRCKSQAGYA